MSNYPHGRISKVPILWCQSRRRPSSRLARVPLEAYINAHLIVALYFYERKDMALNCISLWNVETTFSLITRIIRENVHFLRKKSLILTTRIRRIFMFLREDVHITRFLNSWDFQRENVIDVNKLIKIKVVHTIFISILWNK